MRVCLSDFCIDSFSVEQQLYPNGDHQRMHIHGSLEHQHSPLWQPCASAHTLCPLACPTGAPLAGCSCLLLASPTKLSHTHTSSAPTLAGPPGCTSTEPVPIWFSGPYPGPLLASWSSLKFASECTHTPYPHYVGKDAYPWPPQLWPTPATLAEPHTGFTHAISGLGDTPLPSQWWEAETSTCSISWVHSLGHPQPGPTPEVGALTPHACPPLIGTEP